ncbi:MAG: DUF3098 domain-containing protein [Bacteroidales bacterium]|nr:DUF3098 domain-containing protein [Bacteroidales bacterium]
MSNFSVSPKGVRNMLIGLILMIAGFILMTGGGSSDPNVFNESMFDARKLIVAPIVILLGIAIVIIGIMKTPKDKGE